MLKRKNQHDTIQNYITSTQISVQQGWLSRYIDHATSSAAEHLWFQSRLGQEVYLSYESSRPAPGPSPPPSQSGRTFLSLKATGAWAITRLMAKLRMSGVTPPLLRSPYMPSWPVQVKLYSKSENKSVGRNVMKFVMMMMMMMMMMM
jgi:hypothetical protein